jgi:pyrroline-5-carboxylate reductase
VRAGASAFSMGSACREGDSEIVHDLLSTVGFAVEVPESLIDPVTGLSGSGPSYVCLRSVYLNASCLYKFYVKEFL